MLVSMEKLTKRSIWDLGKMQDIDWKNKNPRSDLILTENIWVVTWQFPNILWGKENKHSEFFYPFMRISGNLIKNTKMSLYYKSLKRQKRKKKSRHDTFGTQSSTKHNSPCREA